jgi:2,4-dienoyl-CoA reductase-like NADH-dependent reductase (Old Yellow Enzyme family)
MSAVSKLFAASRIGRLELDNRFVVAPMTRISATADGLATQRMGDYYERFAVGGFGLIVTEGIYTDRAYAQGYANQPGLTNLAQAHAWRAIVDMIHAKGGRIFAQLMHAGALSQANRHRSHTIAPSALQPRGTQMPIYAGNGPYRLPRVMTEDDILDAIDGFAHAAKLAIDIARFDGIEIHGANGYLLDQFLTEHTNVRTDRWGGSIPNRLRITLQTVHAIRAALGSHVALGVRISQAKVNDHAHKWRGNEDTAQSIFGSLADAPIDFVHTTEPQAWRPAFADEGPSLVQCARRAAPHLRIIANGGLHDGGRAVQVLDHGADLLSLGRSALANPDWPSRLAQGLPPRAFDGSMLSPLAEIKESEVRTSVSQRLEDCA